MHEDVVSAVLGNRINGELFLSLSESDLKELAPAIGDRVCLRKILEEARKVTALTCLIDNFILTSLHQGQAVEGVCEEPHGSSITESNHSVTPAAAPSHAHTRHIEPSNTEICSSEWHINFLIPELRTFSQHVKDAVATGIIPGRVRRVMVQVLCTYMTAHTIRPNSEQYNTVCKKLILKYPKLSDKEGKTKYVWIY